MHDDLRCACCRDDLPASLVAKTAAYSLLRIMYLALPPTEIKESILKPFGGNGVSSGSARQLAHPICCLAHAEEVDP